MCQVCGKPGHSAQVCFYRYERQAPLTNTHRGASVVGVNTIIPVSPSFLVAGQDYMVTHNGNSFIARPETVIDPNWYVDSGATNHVTPDYQNIQQPIDYGGNECVTVGNGSNLFVSHIGSSYICSNSGVLNLENVLCVLAITKNLISVSKLTQDNDVFVELHADSCFVKDAQMGKLVLEGTLNDGLYRLGTT